MKRSEAISKRLIMLCQEKNISVEQLAEQTDADPRAVMAVVNGNGHHCTSGCDGCDLPYSWRNDV